MAYHISNSFEDWFKNQSNKLSFSNIRKLSISSDGAQSFEKLDKSKPEFNKEIESFLLFDQPGFDSVNSLNKKIEYLQNEFGLIGTDDIGIIQMKW